jgi:hypothetical protein
MCPPMAPGHSMPSAVNISAVTPSMAEFEHAYREGMSECTTFANKKGTHNFKSDAQKRLFDNIGVLVWTFGPR